MRGRSGIDAERRFGALPRFEAGASLARPRARPTLARAVRPETSRPSPSPVRLVDYDQRWPALYEIERAKLLWLLGTRVVEIQHIGSTSIPGMGAKPCIDIQVALHDMREVVSSAADLRWLGYRPPDLAAHDWRLLRKLTPTCYHVHLTPYGSGRWDRNILIRDFLRAHPDAAAAYLRLKLFLAATCPDIRAYSEAKLGFIRDAENRARREREGRG